MSDDTISRAAAIDEIARWIGYLDEDMIYRIQTGLKKLPSADPEAEIVKVLKMVEEYKEKTGTDEIIIMPKNGMKAWDENGVEYTMQPTCNQLATDTISRAAAIAEITEYGSRYNLYMSVGELKRRLEQLPSAQPKRTEERTETHACDCISRKGAIDTLFKILDKLNHADFLYADEIYKALNELPPAQPYTTEEIIHCKDCIYAGHNLALHVNWCNNREWFHTVNPYDFCSWAERKKK